jgi:GxxExxY protein
MNADERRYEELTARVIAAFIAVSNDLGVGFLERVYRNSIFVDLTRAGLKVEVEKELIVPYQGVVVGDYFADLVVEDALLIEVKHADGISDAHVAQTSNYLKITGLHLALIVNFGKTKGRMAQSRPRSLAL